MANANIRQHLREAEMSHAVVPGIVRLGRSLMCPIQWSPNSRQGTDSLAHLSGDMAGAEKGLLQGLMTRCC